MSAANQPNKLDQQPRPADLKRSLTRARWSVIQTGLITTGLALFGVYVLANRINDVQVMNLYVFTWVPGGAWIVGAVAGSGYAVASWWNGLRVRGWLLLVVIVLQLLAYLCAHYVQFECMDLLYRETNEPVGFATYFHYVTTNMMPPADEGGGGKQLGRWGYALRGGEALAFCIGVIGSTAVLIGQPTCAVCGGALRRRKIATLAPNFDPAVLAKLEELAVAGNLPAFRAVLASQERREPQHPKDRPEGLELWLFRCAVCGSGSLTTTLHVAQAPTKPPALLPQNQVPVKFVNAFFTPDGHPALTSRPSAPP